MAWEQGVLPAWGWVVGVGGEKVNNPDSSRTMYGFAMVPLKDKSTPAAYPRVYSDSRMVI